MNLDTLPDRHTAEAEIELLKADTDEAREELVLHNLKEAMRFTGAMARGRIPLDEVMSLAGMALMLAVRNYKLGDKPVRLLVYAKPYIRHEVCQAWRLRDPLDYGPDIPDKPGVPDVVEEPSTDPEYNSIHFSELLELAKPHFKKLSEMEQRVLILQYDSKLNGAQIARLLGCTRANIRESRLRALKKIRLALLDEGRLSL